MIRLRTLLLGGAVLVAVVGAALAQMPIAVPAAAPAVTTVVPAASGFLDVGAAFGAARPYIDSLVGSLLSLAIGWLFFLLRSHLKLNIDQGHRDALTAFVLRQASSLVADGFVKVSGLRVQVDSTALRNAALLGEQLVGDAVQFFGLSPASLAERIVDKLPQVPAVAAAMSTTAADVPVVVNGAPIIGR